MKTTTFTCNIVKSLAVLALGASINLNASQAQAGEQDVAKVIAAIAAIAVAAGVANNQSSGGASPATDASASRAQLPATLRTADGDSIRVSGSAGSGSGPTLLCLQTASGMWAKTLTFSNGSNLHSEGGTRACTNVLAGNVQFKFIKAKFAGVMTYVGSSSLDLTGWGGGTVTIDWMTD